MRGSSPRMTSGWTRSPIAPTSASRCSTGPGGGGSGIARSHGRGRVLIGHRFKHDGPEYILPGFDWQMPQGGIDPNENPRPAAERELYEETGVTSIAYLGETPDWLVYDFPPYPGPPHRLAHFRGQRQKWFAYRFLGQESEISV